MKFADRLAMLCERAEHDAKTVSQLAPLVLEHSRRGGPRMPVSGEGGGGRSIGDHSDPTAEEAMNLATAPPEPEVLDQRALLVAFDALDKLNQASKALTIRVPAQAAAIHMGRPAYDGRTEAEHQAMRERRRAVSDDIECVACRQPTGVRRAGMCEACYKAWCRAGRPDRSEWGHQRRQDLERRAEEQAETERLGAA